MNLQLIKPLSLPGRIEENINENQKIPNNKLEAVELTCEEKILYDEIVETLVNSFQRIHVLFNAEDTKEKSILKPKAFSRKDKLSFSNLLVFILADIVGALDDEIIEFFSESATPRMIKSFDSTIEDKRILSEPDLSRERNNISHYPFRRAFEIVRDEYLKLKQRLNIEASNYAVDGSVLALPNFPLLEKFFGVSGKNKDSPSARLSIILDCSTSYIVDAIIAPMRYEERKLFYVGFERLMNLKNFKDKYSCFIFDRWYADYSIIDYLADYENLGFLFRLKKNLFGVSQVPIGESKDKMINGVSCRLIRLKLSTGEIENLLTNVFDKSVDEYQHLYHLRWKDEVAYFFLKRKERVGDFNGRTINSIYQGFWITIVFYNLTILVKMAADIIINSQRRKKKNKYKYEVSLSQIVSFTHTDIIKALILDRTEEELKERIQNMIHRATYYTVKIDDNPRFSPVRRKRSGRKSAFSHQGKVR